MYSVLLHDERLSGNTPDLSDTTGFTVEEDDPIDTVLSWVGTCHFMRGQIEDLAIMCHGYVNPQNGKGGHGLQLSKDGVFLSNINRWSKIQGKAKYIFVVLVDGKAVAGPFDTAAEAVKARDALLEAGHVAPGDMTSERVAKT